VGAGLDHVAAATAEVQEAVAVQVPAVPGVQPAVAQHARGLVGGVPVAQHHVRALHDDIALDARGGVAAGFVDHAQADAPQRPADRAGLVLQAFRRQVGEARRGFGLAVHHEQPGPRDRGAHARGEGR
jgi:hypothetical protein